MLQANLTFGPFFRPLFGPKSIELPPSALSTLPIYCPLLPEYVFEPVEDAESPGGHDQLAAQLRLEPHRRRRRGRGDLLDAARKHLWWDGCYSQGGPIGTIFTCGEADRSSRDKFSFFLLLLS